MAADDLNGARIALLEARMTSELAALVRRHGGQPYSVPAVREAKRDCADEVAAFIGLLSQGALPYVVFLTGVGVRTLLEEASRLGRLEEMKAGLRHATTICRGPKPASVLGGEGMPVSVTVESPYTTAQVVQAIAKLKLRGEGVGLVHYGERSPALAEAAQELGARVTELFLYEWRLPEDIHPLQELIRDLIEGELDAIAFTSQVQARHLIQVASEMGMDRALRVALKERVTVAAVGPTTAAALEELGVHAQVVPEHPNMGPLITALEEYLVRTRNAT